MSMFVIFRWDLGSGGVCNRLEMAVGFKWTDSQPIMSHVSPFQSIFMISVILVSFSGTHKKHENRSELDPYLTNRAENQGF